MLRNERRAEERPSGKVGLVFLVGAARNRNVALAAHTDYKHIHIVKAALAVGCHIFVLLKQKLFNRLPAVVYIAGRAPKMCAGLLYPFVSLVYAPRASREADISAAVGKRQAHTLVKQMALLVHRLKAVIVFKIVYAPGSKGFGIDKFVFERGGVARTGEVARAGIHTEL